MKVPHVVALSAVVLSSVGTCSKLLTVPTTPFLPSNSGNYDLHHLKSIVVDDRYKSATDTEGHTLIPPSLSDFARTFEEDLEESLGLKLNLGSSELTDAHNSIFLTLDQEKDRYLDVAGRQTSEGYTLTVNETGITIAGASPLGVWWGTRSLIHAAVTNQLFLPYGSGVDAPGWVTRGVMLDVARHYYPPDFIVEMCSYLSFFKQNVFHLHLNDNLFINDKIMTRDQILSLYATFRLWSDDPAVKGLNNRANESYSRDDFERIQQECVQRGVTIIPEIDLPAHALAVVQWKPELALQDSLINLSLLNLSHPETMPTIKSIWNIFLPWFHSKRVQIGADEYIATGVVEYTNYVDDLTEFIRNETGQSTRIWADLTPAQGSNVNKNVSIQFWAPYLGNALFDYVRNGYNVVNSDFAWYVSEKWAVYFPTSLHKQLIFNGNPDGGPFSPNIFDTANSSNNAAKDDPLVEGHIAAAWNDFGPLTSTYLEAYHAWRDALPALADKQWGGNISEAEYDTIFDQLHSVIPAQNLDRNIPSNSSVIANYQFEDGSAGEIFDHSGNGYNGTTTNGCMVRNGTLYLNGDCATQTPLNSKGRNATLSFSIYPTSQQPSTLFYSSDSALEVGDNVTLVSGGNRFPLNYSLPLNAWTDVTLALRGNQTFFEVGNTTPMEFLTRFEPNGVQSANGVMVVWASIAIELPFSKIGTDFHGRLRNIQLKDDSKKTSGYPV
ncbi:glycoside hydrolase family 20 protein [Hypoxylon trugodes]|uniref:glycoside hydrolase family 20 protein n=1 Tax=Hypoxylon trugodes TaxID=326681 RepID=UPI0021A10F9E|nr:glycoside hydrolase family 20 protein [Hypoxylon trugodes]KAI1390472.1 glycoside hydrolase family 20 protein [Hypoxylon trugodes]